MLHKSDVAFLQLEEKYDNFFSRKYGQVGSYFVHPPMGGSSSGAPLPISKQCKLL